MKLDEDVKMISAEAPVLFAKAAEIFICELSLRAWIHTEDNKRRTLQRNDIAMAISKYDQFDFLIDIVPRDELKPQKRQEETVRSSSSLPDQIQYYLQLAQQQTQQQQQQQQTVQVQAQTVQVQQPVQVQQQVVSQQPTQTVQQVVTQAAPQQTATVQLPGGQIIQQPITIQNLGVGQAGTPQIVQLQAGQNVVQQLGLGGLQQVVASIPQQQVSQQQQATVMSQLPAQVGVSGAQQTLVQPTTQVYQQVITPSGEVQSIPIQLTAQQLQSIQMQLQGKTSQNIVIQTTQPGQTTSDQIAQLAQQGLYQIQHLGQQAQHIFIQQAEDVDPSEGQEG